MHVARAAEMIGGAQGKYKEWDPKIRIVWGGLGHIPSNFWDFTCSEVCSGGSWGSFSYAHSSYIYTCKMPSSISCFRSKSMTYRALASGLRSSHVRWLWCLRQQHKTWSRLTSVEKLYPRYWPIGKCSVWGPPYTGGPGQTAPVAPLLSAALHVSATVAILRREVLDSNNSLSRFFLPLSSWTSPLPLVGLVCAVSDWVHP